jgi:hypothetical protein
MGAYAQDTPHWTIDPHVFQYDMTAYLSLSAEGVAVTDYSKYEVAAYCGDELRGVGEMMSAEKNGTTYNYVYLRIRSNTSAGDAITFKVYVKDIKGEVTVEDDAVTLSNSPVTVTFNNNDVIGMPSAPVNLDFVPFIPGDADNDGDITINDVVMTINASLNNPGDGFNAAAADVDGDGDITINDIVIIINMTLNINN